MSDFTSDAPMVRTKAAAPKREYYAYFAIIFLAALPLASLMVTALADWVMAPDMVLVSCAWTGPAASMTADTPASRTDLNVLRDMTVLHWLVSG